MNEHAPAAGGTGPHEASGDGPGRTGVAAADTAVPPTRRLAKLAIPALLVGIISAATLYAISALAKVLQDWLWTALPDAVGVAATARWWPVVVLTLTGLAVGAVIRWVPGHAGSDPMRTGLVGAPQPISVVPSLALTLTIGLAGGVSLGPENPIVAINVAIAVWLVARPTKGLTPKAADGLAASGTLGAMFGSPLAAILLMTETLGGGETTRLFDKLFGPLVSAVAGALTMQLLGEPILSVDVAPYSQSHPIDLLTGALVAVGAALITLLAVWLVPSVHRALHAVRSPVLALGIGGFLLGLLGLLAGHDNITLFKGLEQTQNLVVMAPKENWGALLILAFALIKVVAVAVAAGAGFRGGRIFPAAFIGTAVGMAATTAFPSIPPVVAISCGILGSVVVMARDGWLSIFLGALMVNDVRVLPLLCLAMIPVWLLARGCPLMQLAPSSEPEFAVLGPKQSKGAAPGTTSGPASGTAPGE